MSLIFDKKYKLESSDNFDEYCKALGKLSIYNDILFNIYHKYYMPTYFYFVAWISYRILKFKRMKN